MAAYNQGESDSPVDFVGAIPTQLAGRLKWVFIGLGIIVALIILSVLRSIYTDWLWYGELGFRSVFVKVLVTRIALFVGSAAIFAVAAGVSLYFAHRVSRGPEEIPLPPQISGVLGKLIFWGTAAGVTVLSVIFAVIAAGQWEVFLRASNSSTFNIPDPVYLKDVSFYVFALPMYDFLQGWALGAAIVILLATMGIYFVNFSIRGVGILVTSGVRLQVSVLGAIIMLIIGAGLWLDRWGLVLSDQGVVFGAAYTDIHARKVALLVLTIVAVASAILMIINAYMRGVRMLVGAVVLFAVLAFLLLVIWPNAMQRLTVRPNELAKEEVYIARNIEFTNVAFGLDIVKNQAYPVDPTLTAEMVRQNQQTVDNIRLWDRRPLSSVYRFEQVIRPYYDFQDADVDRYVVDGEYRQVMLAAREVALDNLAVENPDSQTWINQRLRYTHGFGVAMSPVNEFTAKGRPEYFAQDIPQDGVIVVQPKGSVNTPETVIENPRIYYGEETRDYVIVNTDTLELDYQAANEGSPRSTRYGDIGGTGGVPIGSFIRQAAYAWEFTDINILVTSELTNSSRVQYRREIQERVSTVAPFLRLDADPYIVAAEGGLFWIQDAYTVSDRYPYSEPVQGDGFNYIRNSVKVVMDAFHGSMSFYVWDTDDPLISTYAKIFPDLFISKDRMPESLQSHVRYPQDLFSFQAIKYLKYHMTEPQDFYNLEDIWSIPREKFGQSGELQPVLPYYVIMKIPGEEREEFVLLLPYTRNEPSPIMAGWLAARNDGEFYGELIALNFPKDRRVKGPEQIEADIDTDENISEWTTLRCDESLGSFCIRGNLLVIPIAADGVFGLLYAEPIYLQAENVEFPALKKVILATDDKVVMEDSVPAALAALTGFIAAPAREPVDDGTPAATQQEPSVSPVQASIDSIGDAMEGLKASISALEEALRELSDEIGGQE